VLALVVLAALSALRWWLGREAERRIRAEIAAAHARGEPILPADFDAPSVPDGQNAALSLRQAADMLDGSQDFYQFETKHPPGQQLTEADRQEIRRILADLQPALRLLRRARAETGIDWGNTMRWSRLTASGPLGYNPQRHLANTIRFAATSCQAIGDDRESVELVRDGLRQAAVIDQAPPALLNQLVALGFTGLFNATVIDLAPKWEIQPATVRPASTRARREQLQQLISELLDDTAFRNAWVQCWWGERANCFESEPRYVEAQLGAAAAFLLRPMNDLDALGGAAQLSDIAAAARQPNLPGALASLPSAATRRMPSHLQEATGAFRWAWGPGGIMRGAGARTFTMFYEALATRRIAAVTVAVQLYRAEHGNRYPVSLAQLVPDYLPSVPIDPMAGNGRPLGYHPDTKPAVVYSVGVNGIDDGGTSLAPASGTSSPWQMPDAVFPLESLPAPASQPSSSKTENDQ
jgi:hypothetical protein